MTDHSKEVRVFVAIAMRLYRDGVIEALLGHDDLAIVGRWNGETETRLIAAASPDVVLLNGWGATSTDVVSEFNRVVPRAQVVIVGIPDGEQHVVACAESGAAGFLTVDASINDLVAVIRGAVRGEVVCSPRSAAALMRRVAARAACDPEHGIDPEPSLTAREWEVIELIDMNFSNKAIANRLQIELSTVKNHVHNVLQKLEVTRRGEVSGRARRLRARSSVKLVGSPQSKHYDAGAQSPLQDSPSPASSLPELWAVES